MTGAILELRDVTKIYGPVTALDGVSFSCRPGTVHALLGENGAGKSTLLGILSGATSPSRGTIRIDGDAVEPSNYDPHRAHELGVTVIHQELALVPQLNVAENVFLGRELGGARLDISAMRRRTRDALDRLGATEISETAIVETLSVAQAQLVEIARSLVFDTRILALDEPSAVLSGDELDALFRVVRSLRDEGVAIIYVSHRLDEVFALADEFTVLRDGAVSGRGGVADATPDDMIRLMVGRDITDIFPPKSTGHGQAALQVEGLAVAGKLRDVDLVAHRGEIVGIAGLMGSGRTTLAKALFGAVPVERGTVRVGTQQGPFPSTRQALAAGLAYLPEDRKVEGLALDKNVRHNVTLLKAADLRNRLGLIDRASERRIASDTVRELSIKADPSGDGPANSLSGGNQQKVVLGKWLLPDPLVLILDEPTRGIDVGAKQQIYALLRRLSNDGRSVIVISSELIEIIGLCDRVLVLADGTVAGELAGDELTEEAIMRLATPGERRKVAG